MADQSFGRMSRRQLLPIGMMSATGALLAACGGGASQPAAQPAAEAPKPAASGQQSAPVSKAQSGKTIKPRS